MPSATNTRLLFNKIPSGYPIPGETTVLDENETIDLDAPLHGGVLIKVLVLGIDPYQRGLMRDSSVESYAPAYQIGQPLKNYGVGVVLRSDNAKVHAGDHLYGIFDFQSYVIEKDLSGLKILKNTEKLPWSVYVGVAGMPGQTAYIGWKLYSEAKKGETLFINTAAGPVGSVVVQLAKSQGLKVVATAGSDEKVAFIKELGADVVFNYKTKDTKKALQELGHGIDIFWDHVGGEMLETVLDATNNFARIINCGAISSYNVSEYHGVRNLGLIVSKRLRLQGFIVLDHIKDCPEFYNIIPQKIASGEIKYREQIYRGLLGAEQALLDVQKGTNQAKAVVILADA